MSLEATVYILRCADGAYYTGLTKQPIESRLWEHNEGLYEGLTKPRRPVTLVSTETYDRLLDAIARARQIKGWSRAKKDALISSDYERLPELARNRQGATMPAKEPSVVSSDLARSNAGSASSDQPGGDPSLDLQR